MTICDAVSMLSSPRAAARVARNGDVYTFAESPRCKAASPPIPPGSRLVTTASAATDKASVRRMVTGFDEPSCASDAFSSRTPPNEETIVPVRLTETVVPRFA